MHEIPVAWSHLDFWKNDWPALDRRLEVEREDHEVLPPKPMIFAALAATAPKDVRAVILGQDPYPTPGHANGLAFSTAPDVRPLPRSLGNIYRELEDDLGITRANGDLSGWAQQGVLLLNTALSVRAGDAGSHARLGWGALIDQIVTECLDRDSIVWILWGRHAQSRLAAIPARPPTHHFIETAHPSPLSARRGFFGSKPFSRANAHLKAEGRAEIDWGA